MELFAFRVAHELGVYDVDAMLHNSKPGLLMRWLSYFQQQEKGENRGGGFKVTRESYEGLTI